MRRAPRGLGFRGEWPIGQQRIEPAGLHLLGQQRRRAEALVRGGIKIDAVAPRRIGAEDEPALVEGTAGNAERVTCQIGYVRTGESGWRDHGPTALENGTKVQSAPVPRWRATQSQSTTIMST